MTSATATARSTCSSSTTSSSSPTRSGPRRSSSTPSTRCTRTEADRPLQRSPPKRDPHARGAAALPIRVGPHRGHEAAGPRDAHRHPAHQVRGTGTASTPRRWSSSPARPPPISASSRARSTGSSPTPGARLPMNAERLGRASNVIYRPRSRHHSREPREGRADYYDVELEALRGQPRARAIGCRGDRNVPHAQGDGRLATAPSALSSGGVTTRRSCTAAERSTRKSHATRTCAGSWPPSASRSTGLLV